MIVGGGGREQRNEMGTYKRFRLRRLEANRDLKVSVGSQTNNL